MSVNNIPDGNRVLRHVSQSRLERDGDTNTIVGVSPLAFRLRDGEAYLSCNWIEFFQGTEREILHESAKAIGRDSKNSRNAVISVAKLRSISRAHKANVRIIHDTKAKDGYSQIRGIAQSDVELQVAACQAVDRLILTASPTLY